MPGDEELVALLLDRARKHMESDDERGMALLRYALGHDAKHKGANEYLITVGSITEEGCCQMQ